MKSNNIKIKNIQATELIEVNKGIREYFTYKKSVFTDSLFNRFLRNNDLKIKNSSTRDLVCILFDFGTVDYLNEVLRVQRSIGKKIDGYKKKRNKANKENIDEVIQFELDSINNLLNILSEEDSEKYIKILDKVNDNKDKYTNMSLLEIRKKLYNDGISITYTNKNKDADGKIIETKETIMYKMLYRTPSKAKEGTVMFINENLYDKAYEWLTMGIKLPDTNAKIVEMSAYAPLTTSTIVDTIKIKPDEILILEDKKYAFQTVANIVTYDSKLKKSYVTKKDNYTMFNTIWDGMSLIDDTFLNENFKHECNGMALLRSHFFKSCAFKCKLTEYLKEYYKDSYDTATITDMFGEKKVKNIKLITTNNSVKWIDKFDSLMGKNPYKYWCNRLKDDKYMFGVVKTDHPSFFGDMQQTSYQHINSLCGSKEQIQKIANYAVDYINDLKNDNEKFYIFLKQNATVVNHYNMLADLYKHNKTYENSKYFRTEKRKIIHDYILKVKGGKMLIPGDNLTVCGNPFALLLYATGQDWKNDPTLNAETGAIQCYTKRFNDGEFLCGFRNPHNAPNNIFYFHNVCSTEMEKYFTFSKNIIAINMIGSDAQDRGNSMDEDSDFVLVTNAEEFVSIAKYAYTNYPTIVNEIEKSTKAYNNTMDDYAVMDNLFAKYQSFIGLSSNCSQKAMTLFWNCKDEDYKQELNNNYILGSVFAQIAIDSCKRLFNIELDEELKKLNNIPEIKSFIPSFYRYIDEANVEKQKTAEEVILTLIKSNNEFLSLFESDAKKLNIKIVTNKMIELTNSLTDEQVKNEYLQKIYNGKAYKDYNCPMQYLIDEVNKCDEISRTKTKNDDYFLKKFEGDSNRRQKTKIMTLIEEYDNFVKKLNACNENLDADSYNEQILIKFEEMLNQISSIKVGNVKTISDLINMAFSLKDEKKKYKRKILTLLYNMYKDESTENNKFLKCFYTEEELENA
jgi:hypothetical protein